MARIVSKKAEEKRIKFRFKNFPFYTFEMHGKKLVKKRTFDRLEHGQT